MEPDSQETRTTFKQLEEKLEIPKEISAQVDTQVESLFTQIAEENGINPESLKKAQEITTKTFNEVCTILNYNEVPVLQANYNIDLDEEFNQAVSSGDWDNKLPTGAAYAQSNRVAFNPNFFKKYDEFKDNTEIRSKLEDELAETIAEEMFHLYTFKKYPNVAYKGLYSNFMGGENYEHDITEKSAKIFAKEYRAYSQNQVETPKTA